MTVWASSALLILLTMAPLAAQEATSQERFQFALALHDAGKYDEAIAIYRELLAQSPDNETVKYELTFSTFAKGDFDGTIRLATEGAAKRGPSQVHYLELLGNAYDSQHRTREAIDAYKRGIKIDPKYPRIHFNLGIAYSGQNKFRDAREELERAIELDPNYASPQLAIADVYRLDGYRVPAILAYGRFLAMEPTGARAAKAANHLQGLLNLGVEQKEKGNINITIDPASKKDLGDFGPLEMMAAIASASSSLPEKAALTEFDREADKLANFLTMFSESSAELKRGFIRDTYAPFYTALVKDEHVSTFAHVALVPLNLAGTEEWMTAHRDEVNAQFPHK